MLPGKSITVTDILQMVRRRIWLLVVPPAVTLFAALVQSSTIPNMYQASMLIAIDPQRVPDTYVRSTVSLVTDRRMDAITVQVLSRTALEQMIESLDLYPEQRAVMPMEDVVARMRNAVSVDLVRPPPQWGQINAPTAFHVNFTYTDPEVAAQVTQLLGSRFVEQNTRDRNALAGATNRFLEEQLAESRRQLEAQERRLEAFRQRHGQELPTQMQANLQALTSAQVQVQGIVESLARDRDRKLMLERLYREAAADPPAPVQAATAAGDPVGITASGGSAQAQLAAARASLASLELRYTPDHPDVARTRRLVADLEPRAAAEAAEAERAGTTEVADAASRQIDPARRESLRQMLAEIESLDRQMEFKEAEERRVRAEIVEYQRRVEAVPGLESEWVKLTRDYDTQQAAYRELLSKSTDARVSAELEEQEIGERFRIVDAASVPVRPLDARRARQNLLGLALGLVFGLGIAALLELRDASYRSDHDVLEVLALPVLASVPLVVTAAERVRQRRRTMVVSAVGVLCLAGAGYVAWTLKLWKSLI